ncbi:uncharacterized protein LOC106865378 isoform X2 [Brachypodium distachyon]|uniref:uncharacterized protein LOC106865378 isoform X2 n=1 Tax=Brachypodium distachyon TaxID=15368 RepID=UPI000D0D2E85|nr:uncharacterized protein LOC106865378 isoform X2 [Brachypodium distachyon]|eukprot:XP_024310228.1 uncharacterized protein LOC106865378 isoform X2 [Brachypodium distachyon]
MAYVGEISPLLPSSCRYVPTCSEYSMQAYKRYGVAKGTILTAWCLCRCNPLSEGQTLGFEISFRSPSIPCEANNLTISSRWNYQSFTFQKLHPWIKSASEQMDCWNKESTNSSHSCHLTRQIISECFFSHVFTVALRKRRKLTT